MENKESTIIKNEIYKRESTQKGHNDILIIF